MGNRLKAWLKAYLAWESRRLIRRALQCDSGPFDALVTEKAVELAGRGMRHIMEEQGMVGCHVCHNRRTTLRRIGPYYACAKHVEITRLQAAYLNGKESVHAAA